MLDSKLIASLFPDATQPAGAATQKPISTPLTQATPKPKPEGEVLPMLEKVGLLEKDLQTLSSQEIIASFNTQDVYAIFAAFDNLKDNLKALHRIHEWHYVNHIWYEWVKITPFDMREAIRRSALNSEGKAKKPK